MGLKVMSFNIRGSTYKEDGANQWKYRAGLNVWTIQRHGPDLVGFQELQRGNLRTYQEEMPRYNYPAIFWKPSKLQLLEWGGFWLNPTLDRPVPGWDAVLVRSANWARFGSVGDGATFLHLNTHLDHIGERSRLESSRLIIARLSELREDEEPLLVTGDFNSSPDSTAYKLFTDFGFRDSYLDAGGENTQTSHAFRGREYVPPHGSGRIDWILTSDGGDLGFQARSGAILHDAKPPLYPSDHYPIVTELTLSHQQFP
ncbi:MAG: endonuclease/exonuclease/phosphatase family protein [Chloroflexota bacterium]|nr:endonuclease/exonuclease/phosphatase family protein [Chloroflexota bacterium]